MLLHFLYLASNKGRPMQNNFGATVRLFKMVFKCGKATWYKGVGIRIEHCQRNPLLGSPVCFYSQPLLMSLKKGHIHNQKRPHTNWGHIQNFNVEKWSDKIALFLDYFGFHRGFLWQCSIVIPTPLYHIASPHLKTILNKPYRSPKVVLHRPPLIWGQIQKMEYPHMLQAG